MNKNIKIEELIYQLTPDMIKCKICNRWIYQNICNNRKYTMCINCTIKDFESIKKEENKL